MNCRCVRLAVLTTARSSLMELAPGLRGELRPCRFWNRHDIVSKWRWWSSLCSGRGLCQCGTQHGEGEWSGWLNLLHTWNMRYIQCGHISEKSLLHTYKCIWVLVNLKFTVCHSKVVHIFEEDFTAVVQPGVDREGLNSEVRYMRVKHVKRVSWQRITVALTWLLV